VQELKLIEPKNFWEQHAAAPVLEKRTFSMTDIETNG
jgi:hypothetical protein